MSSLLSQDAALRGVLSGYHTPWLDWVMWTLSAVGGAGAIWLVIAVVIAVWMPRLRPVAWQVLLALVISQIVVDGVVKPIVGRARPFAAQPAVTVVGAYRPATYSFPSGHASQSFAAAIVLASALPRRKWWLFLLAALIAFSRIYIGVHYPLDVAVGIVVGTGVGLVVTGGSAWYTRGFAIASPLVPR